MTIRDIAIAFGYEVNKQTEKKVEQSISSLKSKAKSALSAIGLGLSLVKANAIVEEFTQINQTLKNVVGESENFAEAQNKILDAANNTKTSYATMTSYVKSLMNSQNSLFSSVEGTLGFAELTTKAFKAAGANESAIASLNSGIQSAFTTGKLSAGTFQSLMESCPQSVEYLSETLGISKRQVKALGQAGAITANQLYSAFSKNATDIEKDYANVAFKISDAVTYIRNNFGMWLYDLNETLGVTKTIAKTMVRGFDVVMGVLKKVTAFVEKLNNKLGGAEKTLKLFAIVGGSLFAVLNAGKIIKFFQTMNSLISVGSAKLLLIAAAIAVVALLVEDFFNFLKGNDSIFGEALSSLGINAEEVREQLLGAFTSMKEALGDLFDSLKNTLGVAFDAIKPSLKMLLGLFAKLTAQILPVLAKLISTVSRIISKVAEAVLPILGEIIGKVIEKVVGIVDKILPKVIGLIEKLLPFIETLIDGILPIVVQLLDLIVPLLDAVFAVLDPLIDTIGLVMDLLAPLIGLLTPILGIILKLVNFALVPVIEVLKVLISVVGNVLGMVITLINAALEPIIAVLGGMMEAVTPIWELLDQLLGEILEPIINVIKQISGTLQGFMELASTLFNSILKPLASVFTLIADILTGTFGSAIATVTDLLKPLLDVLSGVMGFVGDILGGGLSGVTDAIGGVVGGITDAVGGVVGGITDAVGGVVGGISEGVGSVVQGAGNFLSGIGSKIGGLFGLAEGGFIGANNPTPVVIGDNTQEGEIVSPISKMRETVLDALNLFSTASAPTSAASTLRNEVSNRTLSQTVNINNTFNGGSAEQQKNGAIAMRRSADDATGIMARGLAYAR